MPGPQPGPGAPQGPAPQMPAGGPSGPFQQLQNTIINQPKKPVRIVPKYVNKRTQRIQIAVVLAIALVALAYFVIIPDLTTPTTTTTASTTTITVPVGYLEGCRNITQPGSYYLQSGIHTTLTAGACININANNVGIVCNGEAISGSGPYVGVPPFSYGIAIANRSNITINGCIISNFSYGVLATGARDMHMDNNNVTTNYMSDVYFSGVANSTLQNNYIGGSDSPQGAVMLTNGTAAIKMFNNTLKLNAVYGLNLNSSGDTFVNDYVSGSKFAFYCTAGNGFPFSSVASGNVCYNQSGCGFVSCIGDNIPMNLSQIVLGSQIKTCGTIDTPGQYTLASSLDMRSFLNLSMDAQAAAAISCIDVKVPNVDIGCDNHTISDSYIGIAVRSVANVTISDCKVSKSGNGVVVANSSRATLLNLTFTNDNTSIGLYNATVATLTGINASEGGYGLYIYSGGLNLVRNFVLNNDQYGLYVNSSLGNTFAGGFAQRSREFDVYATNDSSNRSSNLMSGTICNVTNTQWAPCTLHTYNALSLEYPISSCESINSPGKYLLAHNLINAVLNCITINTNDTQVNCTGYTINAKPDTPGPAVVISGRHNVSISDCGIINYNEAVVVNDSKSINITDINGTTIAVYGIELNNIQDAYVAHNRIVGPGAAVISLYKTYNSTIFANNVSTGISPNVGILVSNSTADMILNNSGKKNNVGIYLQGASMNNTLANNTFTTSSTADFKCDSQDSAINAEVSGPNYGAIKQDCYWMVMMQISQTPLECISASAPGLYSLTSDYFYYTGSTCFSILAGDSTINCNGHTIIATDGGTFAKFSGANTSVIENCYLKDFTTPIVAQNSGLAVLNNTLYSTNLLNVNTSAINITRSAGIDVGYNRIMSPYVGFYGYNDADGKIVRNNVTTLDGTAFWMYNVDYMQVNNNTAVHSATGLILSNSIINYFYQNNFNGSVHGIVCSGRAVPAANNTDVGRNVCSSQTRCNWIQSSLLTC